MIRFRIADFGLRIERRTWRVCGDQSALPQIRNPGYPLGAAIRNVLRPGLTLIELLIVIIILTTLVSAAIPILAPTNDDRRIREASRMVNAFITGAQMKAVATQRPYGVMIKRLAQQSSATGNNPTNLPTGENNGVSIELQYVEQPPPFVGFSDSSSARVALYEPANTSLYGGRRPLVLIQFVARGNNVATSVDGLSDGWDGDLLPEATIRPGDFVDGTPRIQVQPGDVIDVNGTQYELLSDGDDGNINAKWSDGKHTFFAQDTGKASPNKAPQIVARPINDTGQLINARYDDYGNELAYGTVNSGSDRFWTPPARYKILRQPSETSAEPLQMPDGTAIDLRASGVGANDYFYVAKDPSRPVQSTDVDNPEGIVIMFAPEGRVSRLIYNRQPGNVERYDQPVVDNIYLLVGRRELAPPPAVAVDPTLDDNKLPAKNSELYTDAREAVNWLRGESRWIGIGAQSGRVVTVENAFVDPIRTIEQFFNPPNVTKSSEEMRNGQITDARAFARQMSQLGGR